MARPLITGAWLATELELLELEPLEILPADIEDVATPLLAELPDEPATAAAVAGDSLDPSLSPPQALSVNASAHAQHTARIFLPNNIRVSARGLIYQQLLELHASQSGPLVSGKNNFGRRVTYDYGSSLNLSQA